jgi:hypothetical protein
MHRHRLTIDIRQLLPCHSLNNFQSPRLPEQALGVKNELPVRASRKGYRGSVIAVITVTLENIPTALIFHPHHHHGSLVLENPSQARSIRWA